MAAEHHLSFSAVQGLADTIASQEQPMRDLAGPLHEGAGAVHTGDSGLDAETQAAVGRMADLLTRIGAEFGHTAQDVREVATEFQDFHQQVADDQNQVVSALPDAGAIG